MTKRSIKKRNYLEVSIVYRMAFFPREKGLLAEKAFLGKITGSAKHFQTLNIYSIT